MAIFSWPGKRQAREKKEKTMKRTAVLTAALMLAGMTSVSFARDETTETKQNGITSVTSGAETTRKVVPPQQPGAPVKPEAVTPASPTSMNQSKTLQPMPGQPTATTSDAAKSTMPARENNATKTVTGTTTSAAPSPPSLPANPTPATAKNAVNPTAPSPATVPTK
jgi:hypothetical protein